MVTIRLAGAAGALGLVLVTGGCMVTHGEGATAPGTVLLNKNVPLETEHNQVVHLKKKIRDTEHDFQVLFGPYPPGDRNKGRGEFRNPEPEWHTLDGYAFCWGWWPIVTTQRVKAFAEGTTMIVQTGSSFDRVYFVHPDRDATVRVEDAGNPNNFKILSTEAYVQASGSAGSVTFTDPQSIPASGEICEFVKYVIDLARSAGYTGEAWECGAAAGADASTDK